ncbi:MAG TPA: BrnT family toxin [Allosphingosinicella sp.]|nr:BrnT family toxin [Allosphingosinicella sp.]
MKIEFDPEKREKVLRERGLDLADAAEVLSGDCYEIPDDRFPYGEARWVSLGFLRGQVVACVWALGEEDCVRIVTMWKANGNEQAKYFRFIEGR